MDGPDLGTITGAALAVLASAGRRLSVGRASGLRSPGLVEAPGLAASGLHRSAVLPRALVAVFHPRRARLRLDLRALQRHRDPLRRNPRRPASPNSAVGGT